MGPHIILNTHFQITDGIKKFIRTPRVSQVLLVNPSLFTAVTQ